MNPWKIIGWIVLAFIALLLYSCFRVMGGMADTESPKPAQATSQEPAPDYRLTVVSSTCRNDYGRDRAEITVRNTGQVAIPFAKVFVEFRDKANKTIAARDTYFSPTTIPAGSTASATAYSGGGGADSCGPTSMQDGDGRPIQFTQG